MKKFYTQVRRLVLLTLTILFTSNLLGQISIGTLPYVPGATNFNAYNPNNAGNYAATIPAGWTGVTGGTTTYNGQGTGTTFNGGYWGYGSAGEFCLGAMPSGASTPITYAVSYTNNSGSTITTLTISWDYEQWSYSSGNNNTWNCTATGGLAGNATINAQDYNNVNGTNGVVTTTSISFTLTGLNITNGSTFGIQWAVADAGSAAPDKGIGIDNFNIIASNTANTDYFRSRQTGNWATVTTWESSKDDITWVNSSLAPDNNANTVTILSGHIVTVAASVSTDETTINSGGQVSVSAGQTFTIANGTGTDLTVDGTLLNSGTVTPTGAIQFNALSAYRHAMNAGTIPAATWNLTSTCYVTGTTSTAPAGLGQAFGNFTWDCPGHSTLINLNAALTTVNGDFTVRYAGQIQGVRTQNGLALSLNAPLTLNIGGNFNVDHYSSEATWLILSTGTSTVNVNVAGDFNMSRTGTGTCFFDYKQNVASTIGSLTLNISGNFNQTGGYFDWTFETNGGAVFTRMYLAGNFSFTGSSIMITSTATGTIPNGRIYFNKAGTQTVTVTTPTNLVYTNFEVVSGSTVELLSNINLQSSTNIPWGGQFVVNSGGILDCNTFQINSSTGLTTGSNNAFTLSSGAGVITANLNGLHQTGFVGPSVSAAIATRTFSSLANYTYDGIAAQVSGIFITTPTANTVNNLTINNSAGTASTGVSLTQPIAVAGTLTLSNGLLTTTTTNLLTINSGASVAGQNYAGRISGGSNNSFVNGIMRKLGNTDFLFPVGKLNEGHRYCGISSNADAANRSYDAEFMRASASQLGPITSIGLAQVSHCEYWRINRVVGTNNLNVTLSWSNLSQCNTIAYVTNLATLVVAHFGATSWDSHGASSTTGDVLNGSITWNYTGTYNALNTPFSLGSLNWFDNPLPVKFTSVTAYKVQAGNKVEWTNMSEESIVAYELERSDNGRNFNTAYSQQPRMNNGSKVDYGWIDINPNSNITYYRIKATDIKGAITYSPIVKVQTGSGMNDVFTVYPNPVVSHQFTVQLSGKADNYKIRLLNNFGQEIMNTNWQHNGGMVTRTIELSPSVSRGVYHLQVIGKDQTRHTKIYIQ